ncbi:MAG: M48 family metallopeptidase [Verrucomicrobiales bacterium]
MNFFAAQERARTQTRWLVVGFALCVGVVVLAVFALAVVVKGMMNDDPGSDGFAWRDLELFASIAPSVALLIGAGSAYKLMQLSGGGRVVARDLGGRPVAPDTSDPLERRLLNVVEEMAIAAGTPVPEVWLLDDEEGINAFAAGTDATNAVIGVTHGCVRRLTRDELQGVVAHEFSHIVNGDMRLNQRLVGWVFGLVMVALLGRGLFSVLRHFRVSSNDRDGAGAVVLLLVIAGGGLWVIGSIGTVLARILQAAVSRQREFLADAAAVQFTRNPRGLAGALAKVGGFATHGRILTPKAEEARHLFFASSDFFSLGLATHPPLPERIRRIDPQWDGQMKLSAEGETSDPATPHAESPVTTTRDPQLASGLAETSRIHTGVGLALHQRLHHLEGAGNQHFEAQARLLGLLLAQNRTPADSLAAWQPRLSPHLAARAAHWQREAVGLSSAEKLALVDLSLPWLRRLSPDDGRRFIAATETLVAADGRVDLFEFMLQKVIERHVAVGLGLRPVARVRHRRLHPLATEAAVILQAVAAASGSPDALSAAAVDFRHQTGAPLPAGPATIDWLRLTPALRELEAATPPVKESLLRLVGIVATEDGRIEDAELELVRAIAEAIGAPVPPFLRVINSQSERGRSGNAPADQ